MIHRNYKEGEQLDVSGLNVITVLLDRSESKVTEIGYNEWRPKLDGPPHKHLDKDQIFYIHSGVGVVRLGDQQHDVTPGDVVYVPAGLVHQTITMGGRPLCYVLFNVFNDATKEGHATFAEHIEKVKLIRKQQADTGKADVDGSGSGGNVNSPKVIRDFSSGEMQNNSSPDSHMLLDRNETNRLTFSVMQWPPDSVDSIAADKEHEKSFFVVKGEGIISVNGKVAVIKPGDLFYIPPDSSFSMQSKDMGVTMLNLNSAISQ